MRILLPLLLILSLHPALPSGADAPPKEPLLRLGPAMHTAMIRGMSIDRSGRFLATASDDKTVKVWEHEKSSLRLLRTLRLPIGYDEEGRPYAVAVSPDGSTIAAGGWTGIAWDRQACIYLFELRTGAMKGRITGLPSPVNRLLYSPDGRFLAASFPKNIGIRIYRAADLAEAGRDAEYGDQSYGIAFLSPGTGGLRLATTSYDGHLRLYEVAAGSAPLRPVAKIRTPGGSKPHDIAAARTGAVAVGYEDTAAVSIFSGDGLARHTAADTNGIGNGNLSSVAWSADGQTLYAGGRYWKDNKVPLVSWGSEGRGKRSEVDIGATNTILALLPLPDNAVLAGSADPLIARAAGKKGSVLQRSDTADFRDIHEGLRLSERGDSVGFGYQQFGKAPAVFDIAARSLSAGAGGAGLKAPVVLSSSLTVTGWDDTTAPTVNGKPIALEPFEVSLSLALSPDASWFALGTQWYLYAFGRDGSQRWKVPVPADAVGVTVSGDGRMVVAACGDGTIRWHRSSDGRQLLALYPHPDRKRWVIWTPQGYYDTSPGAEELIGWHVNNGADQAADFFPASRFRSRFYRPDVIAKVIAAPDEPDAAGIADRESGRTRQEVPVQQVLPPVVTILSPPDGAQVASTDVLVKFSVRGPAGVPVTGIRALVGGRPVSMTRGVTFKPEAGEQRELTVTVPEADTEISLIAENQFAASEPATVRVRWAGAKKRQEFVIQPKLYVLAVGVSRYLDPNLVLDLSAKDAGDFANAMLRQKGGLYRDVTVRVLTNEQATKDNILDGLDWIQKETTSKDVAVVFFSGHGVNDQNGVYYYLPVNVELAKLKRTAVVFADIRNTVQALAGKALFFIDTCHSGNVMGTRRALSDITAVVNELASAENGVVVFASSTGSQYSLEHASWGNGAFTKALVEGINGKADYARTGKISVNMLDLYLSERVKELTQGKQTPTTTKPHTVPDFPVAMKR